jgi:Lysozyme like domain
MATLVLTSDEVAELLVQAGAQGWTVVTMGAIAVPESGRNGYAINVNDSPEKPSHRSLDVGLFQINTFFNPKHAILTCSTRPTTRVWHLGFSRVRVAHRLGTGAGTRSLPGCTSPISRKLARPPVASA